MTEQPNTAAELNRRREALTVAAIRRLGVPPEVHSDYELRAAILWDRSTDTGHDWDLLHYDRRVLINCLAWVAEARQQDGSALRLLLDAIETMDQKITPYGEREDGTILNYIVADSTWHRILAAARSSEIYAALPPSAPAALHQHEIDAGPCDCSEPLPDIEHWYAAFEKVTGQEATTHDGKSRIYYEFAAEYARLQEPER